MIVATAVFVVFAVASLGAGVAIFALFWAEKNRQFDDVTSGAMSIFDAEEPAGTLTDQILAPAASPEVPSARSASGGSR